MALPLEGAQVWAKTPADDLAGYELAKAIVGQAGPKLVVEVDSSGAKRELDPSEMLEANPGPAVPDLTTMVVLNAATMLHNVRERYSHDRIYTRASNMLVAVNPGHPLPELYTEGARSKSKKADLRDPRLEPHLRRGGAGFPPARCRKSRSRSSSRARVAPAKLSRSNTA